MQKKTIFYILMGLAITSIIFTATLARGDPQREISCANETLFDKFGQNGIPSRAVPDLLLDDEGNIAYLYDDFSAYGKNQVLVDGFEDPSKWHVDAGELVFTDEYYGGSGALSYTVPSGLSKELVFSKTFESFDTGKYSHSGYITMWLKASESDAIDSINIVWEDTNGNKRIYTPLKNIHTSAPNTFANESEYPDLVYPEGDPARERWTDFVLADGWNYLLWRADMHTDIGAIDMSDIKTVHIHLQMNGSMAGEELVLDNLRMQDGLQRLSNPTKGAWYPPHGRPQYGVYDIDRRADGTGYELRLLNVRSTQYPSNGDHARMISSAPVPEDFAMRVKFKLIQLGQEDETIVLPSPFPAWTPQEIREVSVNKGHRDNSYFRVTYDFEPSWDPGHDWFGAYLSLQYDKFGVMSVWPVERNLLQEQEPKAGFSTATTEFIPQEGVQYEMQLVVKGQFTATTIYEVKDDDCLERKAGISYIFEHQRYGDGNRYPFAIESTGNMRSIIHEVELVSGGDNASNGS